MKPTQRHTKSRSRIRRAAVKMKSKKMLNSRKLTTCPKCKKPVKPHTACAFCGTYKKKEVLKIKLSKTERKAAAKKEKVDRAKDAARKKEEKKAVKKDSKTKTKK